MWVFKVVFGFDCSLKKVLSHFDVLQTQIVLDRQGVPKNPCFLGFPWCKGNNKFDNLSIPIFSLIFWMFSFMKATAYNSELNKTGSCTFARGLVGRPRRQTSSFNFNWFQVLFDWIYFCKLLSGNEINKLDKMLQLWVSFAPEQDFGTKILCRPLASG